MVLACLREGGHAHPETSEHIHHGSITYKTAFNNDNLNDTVNSASYHYRR
jgi:hypothetical protein